MHQKILDIHKIYCYVIYTQKGVILSEHRCAVCGITICIQHYCVTTTSNNVSSLELIINIGNRLLGEIKMSIFVQVMHASLLPFYARKHDDNHFLGAFVIYSLIQNDDNIIYFFQDACLGIFSKP